MKDTVGGRQQQAFRLKGTAPALTLLYMLPVFKVNTGDITRHLGTKLRLVQGGDSCRVLFMISGLTFTYGLYCYNCRRWGRRGFIFAAAGRQCQDSTGT